MKHDRFIAKLPVDVMLKVTFSPEFGSYTDMAASRLKEIVSKLPEGAGPPFRDQLLIDNMHTFFDDRTLSLWLHRDETLSADGKHQAEELFARLLKRGEETANFFQPEDGIEACKVMLRLSLYDEDLIPAWLNKLDSRVGYIEWYYRGPSLNF